MITIAKGWPRSLNGAKPGLIYRLDADAGDWLATPSSVVHCSHDIEIRQGQIYFNEPVKDCYCEINF